LNTELVRLRMRRGPAPSGAIDMTIMTSIDPLHADAAHRYGTSQISLDDDARADKVPLSIVFPLLLATSLLLWVVVAGLVKLAVSFAPLS
jgi:hypothetical protein